MVAGHDDDDDDEDADNENDGGQKMDGFHDTGILARVDHKLPIHCLVDLRAISRPFDHVKPGVFEACAHVGAFPFVYMMYGRAYT